MSTAADQNSYGTTLARLNQTSKPSLSGRQLTAQRLRNEALDILNAAQVRADELYRQASFHEAVEIKELMIPGVSSRASQHGLSCDMTVERDGGILILLSNKSGDHVSHRFPKGDISNGLCKNQLSPIMDHLIRTLTDGAKL